MSDLKHVAFEFIIVYHFFDWLILTDDLTTRIDIGRQYWITGMVVVDAMNHVTPQQFYFASLEVRHKIANKCMMDEETDHSSMLLKTLFEAKAKTKE